MKENMDKEQVETPKPKKKRIEHKNTAYGVVQEAPRRAENGDVIIGKFQIVAIKFDLDTGQLGDVSITEMEDLGYALETVQINLETEIAQLAKEN